MSNHNNAEETKPSAAASTQPAIPPNIGIPLLNTTNQPTVTGEANLGLLNSFIGSWVSPPGTAATGYNVMPLPQVTAPNGYITKNFPYFEEITFTPIAGGAPNRQGDFTQSSGVLFYEQRVYFANNPDPNGNQPIQNTLIHAENGTWLYHTIQEQTDGPYGPGVVTALNPLPTQDPTTQYNKQVSVPHGNSVLMTGGPVVSAQGSPSFTPVSRTLPPFTDPTVIDPSTYLTQQLKELAANGISVNSYSSITVSSTNKGGGISNIHFEERYGKVVSMDTTWYVENLSNGAVQLQYVQNIVLEFQIAGQPTRFLHVDANTLQSSIQSS